MALQTPMLTVRTLRASVVVAAILLGAFASAPPAAPAETLAPWWGLTSGERPTSLQPGAGAGAKNEVQLLTVKATKGDVLLALNPGTAFETHALIPFNATATQVQQAIETAGKTKEGLYPGRKVVVTGGPGDEKGSNPYTITFPDQSVAPILATGEPQIFVELLNEGEVLTLPGECEGEPCRGTATVTVVQEGAPDNQIIATAENRGDASTSGIVTMVDKLPAGVEAVAIEGFAIINGGNVRGPVACTLEKLTCTFGGEVANESEGSLPPYEQIEVRIAVVVKPGAATGEPNTATVSGGGAARTASASHPIIVNGSERFGIEDWQFIPENPGGTIDTQAGSHPFQATNVVTLNTGPPDPKGHPRTAALPKDIGGELPAGFVGNPTPFAQCTDAQFAASVKVKQEQVVINECPARSAIGVATVSFSLPGASNGIESSAVPIFNMVPRPGEPVRFGFKVEGIIAAFLDTSVRTGGDYGVTVTSSNITEVSWLLSVKFAFWGVPGDSRHDGQRGWECLDQFGTCPASTATSRPPFLVMPTSCGPFNSTVHADSWAASGHPSQQAEPITYGLPEAIDGCNHLPFDPSIEVKPDVPDASTSTGLTVSVHLPQTAELNPEGLAESSLRDTTVALPEGMAVNPASGDGRETCSEGLVGFTGFAELDPASESGAQTATFTPKLPGSFGSSELLQPGVNFCPNASKVGTVKIKLPILPNPLEGAIYLATQNENPFGSLITLYLVAEDPVSGVLVKVTGEVHLTATGQLVTTFKNSPQGPLEELELHFFGGERAPLATPAHCGSYTTNATFAPWSGNAPANVSSTFEIEHGPNGGPCPGQSLPFSPSLTGGSTNINAGAFSPLTTTIGREDGQQDMQAVQLHMPAGLSGLLSGVKLCPEAQANEGTCGPESEIGETTVSAGVGSAPVSVKGGRVYITEKYAGAPFGLSIVNPVKAGPFDLEHDTSNPAQQPPCDCIVVRAKIEVDPHTAALTVTTDSSGPHAIPHLIDGIPVQIKKVNVLINRPGFTFNPTNCNPMSLTGTIASDEGASSPVLVPFQATNCKNLAFTPEFTVSTSGKTSKANGASLTAKVSEPAGAFGTQANISRVKVDLPKQLPSRLTTLQKACTDKQFNENPAGCPSESKIGYAVVHTPLLPVPLTGPAIFVSHGDEAFPSLEIVLQGDGVTIDLVGATDIKNGVTSTTFKTVPDTPFSTFELTLPEGKYSALAANGNLCSLTKTITVKKKVTITVHGHKRRVTRKVKETVASLPGHAQRIRRPKRRHAPPEHTCERYGLPEAPQGKGG